MDLCGRLRRGGKVAGLQHSFCAPREAYVNGIVIFMLECIRHVTHLSTRNLQMHCLLYRVQVACTVSASIPLKCMCGIMLSCEDHEVPALQSHDRMHVP